MISPMPLMVNPAREHTRMAKKKSPAPADTGRIPPAYLRRAVVSVADMQQKVVDCRDWLQEIDTLLAQAEAAGVIEFEVDGVTKLDQAYKLISSFAPLAYKGISPLIRQKPETR